jgi:hypothetical protein
MLADSRNVRQLIPLSQPGWRLPRPPPAFKAPRPATSTSTSGSGSSGTRLSLSMVHDAAGQPLAERPQRAQLGSSSGRSGASAIGRRLSCSISIRSTISSTIIGNSMAGENVWVICIIRNRSRYTCLVLGNTPAPRSARLARCRPPRGPRAFCPRREASARCTRCSSSAGVRGRLRFLLKKSVGG